jgi:hypothetical protein
MLLNLKASHMGAQGLCSAGDIHSGRRQMLVRLTVRMALAGNLQLLVRAPVTQTF